jgi:hypothetical protein
MVGKWDWLGISERRIPRGPNDEIQPAKARLTYWLPWSE